MTKKIDVFSNFTNALIDFVTNHSASSMAKIMLKKTLFFARFCLIVFGILLLFGLSLAPFLRDISALSGVAYEKFGQDFRHNVSLDSTLLDSATLDFASNDDKKSAEQNLQALEQNTQNTEVKTHFLHAFSHLLDTKAQDIDSAFSGFLHSLSPVIIKYFGDILRDLLLDSSEANFAQDFIESKIDSTQPTQTAQTTQSTQESQNPQESTNKMLENLIAQKLVYNYTQISTPTYDTIYMVSISTIIAVLFGLPLGVLLCLTKRGRIFACEWLNSIVGTMVNIIRSFPFIILIILLLPLSRLIVGTSIGSSAAIIPLSIAAIPFIARLFEGALDEVDKGLIEATLSLGASKIAVIKMMIAEALPSICNAVVITIIGLIGYSAMGGAVGAGGLGDTAIRLGFQGYQPDILCSTVVVIIILVQCVQGVGDSLVAHLRKYR